VLLEIAQSKGIRAMAQEWVKGMVHPSRLADKALIETILKMFETKNSDIFARQLVGVDFSKRCYGCFEINQRANPHFVWPARRLVTPSQHEEMLQYVPHAAMSVIEEAGHMSTMEKPQAVAEAMNRWLSVI
jgi:pimeloyl-ACP methyl ester carboxylesterase